MGRLQERLARLTSLFEDHIKAEVVHPRSPSPLLNQQVPRPFIQITSHLPRETHRPNLQQPIPIAPPAFRATSQPTDQSSGSRGKPNRQKIDKDKRWWDLIPITYTELFPKLVEISHIEPVQLTPLRPLFPRWYNARTRYDYQGENSGHPTKNCTAFKHKVQDLINLGKLKFKENEPTGVENLFGAKTETTR